MELAISTAKPNKSIKIIFAAALFVVLAADFVIDMPLIEKYQSIGQYQENCSDGSPYGTGGNGTSAYSTYQVMTNVDKPRYEELY